MFKIVFLTNIIRKMGIMQQTLTALQNENKISEKSACLWITGNTEWEFRFCRHSFNKVDGHRHG